MEPTFYSSKLLLLRAKMHLTQFVMITASFGQSSPYTLFRDKNRKTGKVLFKANVRPIPPTLPPIAFDILNCLRSSLDHAVFDAARILGGNPKPKYTKFPFGKTRTAAKKDLPRKKAEVPVVLARHLLTYKPYMRGNKALWALNELRNDKIHRTLSVMAIANRSVSFNNGFIGNIHVDHIRPRWNSHKLELTYMTACKVEDFNMDVTIQVLVTFGQGTPFTGKPAVAVLGNLVSMVESILNGIELKTASLKNPAG